MNNKHLFRRFSCVAAASLFVVAGLTSPAAAGDPKPLLKKMPADLAIAVVLTDMQKMDETLHKIVRRLGPDDAYESVVDQFKEELSIGAWIDFTKPIGIGLPNIGPSEEPVFWVAVPDFSTKVKDLDGATQEEGIWRIPGPMGEDLFVKIDGAYIIASEQKSVLAGIVVKDKSLADVLRSRMELLEGRDVFVHVSGERIRPMVLGSLAQFGPMLPSMVMMMGGAAGDPAALIGMINGGLEGVTKFVEQVDYLDMSIKLDPAAADVTIATGFMEGAIKSYLAKQKPARSKLLSDLEDQPYLMAAAYEMTGDDSPVFEFFMNKMLEGMASQSGSMGAGDKEGDGKDKSNEAMVDAMKLARDAFNMIDGMSMIMAFSSDGMRMAGNYITSDPKGLLALTKKQLTQSNELMEKFSAGITYESVGASKVGNIDVEGFKITVDTSNPAAAMAGSMYGPDSRYVLGIVGDAVRYCMGNESYIKKAFSSQVTKPMTASQHVKDSLAALPAKVNMIMVLDPAGALPMVGPMFGMPVDVSSLPAAPPIAASLSLSGENARLDIHVPIRAIERVIKALSPQEPL